jgi:hypothetical protein
MWDKANDGPDNCRARPLKLAIMAFGLTWICLGLIQFVGRGAPHSADER